MINDHCEVTTDDGAKIRLGDTVWINHTTASPGPLEAKLVGVRIKVNDGCNWPWIVEYEQEERDNSKSKNQVHWGHIYSTRDKAISAEPWPEIVRLRSEIDRLKRRVKELE